MNEKIYELQSPEWERTVMMHLIIKGDAEKVAELVADGWGVYPEILNLLAAFEDTKVLNKVLKAAAAVERYNVERLCGWFKAFFGAGWKKEVVEYRLQGYDMFNDMTASIREETVRMLMHVRIEEKVEREQVAKVTGTNKDDSAVRAPKKREAAKIYPNDPCPCGSGKKYKHCCGR